MVKAHTGFIILVIRLFTNAKIKKQQKNQLINLEFGKLRKIRLKLCLPSNKLALYV